MQNRNRKIERKKNHTGEHKDLRGSAIGLHPQAVLRKSFTKKIGPITKIV